MPKCSAVAARLPNLAIKRSAGLIDMRANIARFPCSSKRSLLNMQNASFACSLLSMETIGKRIERLRGSKSWSRPELGRQMAKAVGRPKPFSGESIRRYEECIDEPGNAARAALAKVFGKSEQYIEFGESSATSPKKHSSIDSPEVERLVKAFGWLMDDERKALLTDLEAKALTNRQIAKSLGPRFTYKTDQAMLDHLKKSGDFPPGTKKTRKVAGPKKTPGFREDDPE